MAAGLTAGAALVDYGISRGDLVLMGAVTGVGVGVLQALVLARSRVSGAFWWAIANPPAWALGWLVTSYVITRNVQDQFTNFGASGALVFGLLTWLLLAALFRDTEPQAHTMNMQNAAGVLLIVLPLAFNLFFFLLARRFDYPNILRSPSADVLSRFKAGGFSLKLLWYGFMLTAVLLDRSPSSSGKCSAATAWPSSPPRPRSASSRLSCWLAWPGIAIGLALLVGSLEFVGPFEEKGSCVVSCAWIVPVAFAPGTLCELAPEVVFGAEALDLGRDRRRRPRRARDQAGPSRRPRAR
jgi:hypothetical protein